jgi:photosystem II stability/assembly factor-like uncharacterized protein
LSGVIRRLSVLLLCALPLLAAPLASAQPERPRDFLEDAMVSGASGWARTYRGIYWTDDGGAVWRNITPPLAHPAALQAVGFADTEHGWALAEEGREAHPRAALFATQSGGRSWTRTRIHFKGRYSQAGSASFAAVGAHRVFALVRESRNTAFSIGYLLVSRDGGRHWHQLPEQPPHAGEIVFTSARDGWLAEEGPSPALYRTRDGGRSWREVRLQRPPGLDKARADYLAPRFEADGHGVLAATYDNFEERAFTVLYTSEDFGQHWTLAASTRLLVEGDPAVFAYRGDDSVATAIYPAPRLGLFSVGTPSRALAGTGLPTEYSPSLSFSGSEDGFGRIDAEDCIGRADVAHCTEVNGLYFSADGGESWKPTARP